MAILNLDTLTGCTSIPSFIGGESDTPGNPSYTIFNNSNAPTSWVKDTSHNNKALRVIGGSNGTPISSGGSVVFTTVLSSGKTFSSVASQIGVSGNFVQNSSGFSPLPTIVATNSSGSHTPSVTTMAAHNHVAVSSPNQISGQSVFSSPAPLLSNVTNNFGTAAVSGSSPAPDNTPHSHDVVAPHTHPVTVTQHAHPFTTTQHSHSITMSENFSVNYVDVIIAKKS